MLLSSFFLHLTGTSTSPPPPKCSCRPSVAIKPPRLCCLPSSSYTTTTTILLSHFTTPPLRQSCVVFTSLRSSSSHFDCRPSYSTTPPWLCCLPSPTIAITPTIFWSSSLHTWRAMLFSSSFTDATTILLSTTLLLPSSTSSTTTLLSSFPLYHTAAVILSILLHHTVRVMLSSLLHPNYSKNSAWAPLTRDSFCQSLNTMFFAFTLILSKMWYSCGHNGRDRLWKNLPYSVHVWLTIRTRRTQEHVAHEGKKLTIVIIIYSL